MIHIPVLRKEVIDYLSPKQNQNFIDCTIGGGGHTAAILEKNCPNGKVLGIEVDPEFCQKTKLRMAGFSISNFQFLNRLVLVNDNFANLKKIVERYEFKPVQGILLDLGMSSWHLEESGRGFSFLKDEPLIMRYSWRGVENNGLTAEKLLNEWSERDLEKIFREYGEERFAKKIAQKIVEQREIKSIKSTFQLVKIIKRALPRWYGQKKHFATKTFQALRIAVNSELENLKSVLPQAIEILEPEGRLVVISFHSLEDRIAKFFFREKKEEGLLSILTKKPVKPTPEEIKLNPRARSAKLRAVLKL